MTAMLADFLLARIAKDEAVARHAASLGADFIGYDTGDRGDGWRGDAGPYDPARVLARCERDRRIVALHGTYHECTDGRLHGTGEDEGDVDDANSLCETIRAFAAVYADHPDFREEWRP